MKRFGSVIRISKSNWDALKRTMQIFGQKFWKYYMSVMCVTFRFTCMVSFYLSTWNMLEVISNKIWIDRVKSDNILSGEIR